MHAFATAPRRRGLSLTEVLVAIFIMAIGLMALLTLFPLGALNMAQAIKDDRTGNSAANGAAVAHTIWRMLVANNPANPDPTLTPILLNAGKVSYPNLPDLTGTTGPGYWVYIDPFGYNGQYNYGGAGPYASWQTWLAGSPAGSLPRYSKDPLPPPPPGWQAITTYGYFSNNDDITFGENGTPPAPGGAAGSVERRRQYSWAFLVRLANCSDPQHLNLTVVVYSGRPLQTAPDAVPTGEAVYQANVVPGRNTLTLTWGAGQDKPAVRRGSWILDATAADTPPRGYFYRVVDITDTGANSMLLELQTNLQGYQQVPAQVVILDGVAEVFQKPQIPTGAP
jgi:prepilin-type N-terminal cleavage/methylation domain-containing protein